MFISDKIISLRIAEPSDATLIYIWENDRSIWRVSDASAPLSLFQIEQFLQGTNNLTTDHQMRLMVVLNETNETIGTIDFFDYDSVHQRVSIGILIDNQHRDKGYGKRALQLSIDYLFTDVMVHQIFATVDSINTESLHVFKELGFENCGCRKEWIRTPNYYIDLYEFQLIHHEKNEKK